MALLSSPLHAREDNARLVFQKTADGGKNRVHVVKKGESLAGIIRSQFGNRQVSYTVIRRLNPEIRNLNRIRPGQRIVFPVADDMESPESISGIDGENSSPPIVYRIRKGDSVSRIILSELDVSPAEALPAYRLIRKLNPEILDLNRIQVGQTLRLPPPAPLPAFPLAAPPKTASVPTEDYRTEAASKTPPTPDALIGIIRPVINRMQGTITASGNYFIPLQETAQITIDCSLIPVVELDDGTTVLLDFGNRLVQNLKELIRQSWKNCTFVPADELIDGISGLQGIIRRSHNYSMVKTDKPVSLNENPEIIAFPDWIITSREKAGGTAYRQALFLLGPGERPLPVEARAALEKSGVTLTEIVGDRAVSFPETPQPLRPVTADLRGLKGMALAEQLLAALGETTVRNTDIVIFDQARNGFNLSITADLLMRKGEKRLILHTKKLPDQFLQVLREAGTEVIPINEKDQGRSLIEGVLHGLGIPVSFGYFTFRIPEEGKHPRFTASFSALKAIKEETPVYLVDFDLPPSVLPFLIGRRGGGVLRY